MEKKQVIIVSLLIIAIILSTASVVMNLSIANEISEAKGISAPQGDISLEILPTKENTGVANELG